jgi:hypothetical protein
VVPRLSRAGGLGAAVANLETLGDARCDRKETANGKVRKAVREGPVRIHWSDSSYSDFDSRDEALEHAALAEDPKSTRRGWKIQRKA